MFQLDIIIFMKIGYFPRIISVPYDDCYKNIHFSNLWLLTSGHGVAIDCVTIVVILIMTSPPT